MFDRETEFVVSPEVLLLCTRGDGARDQGWAKTGGESSQGEEGQSGVNLRHGVRGEENINRACCAEASCHGPLQEKD